jgi:hypothetical protein
MEEYFIFQTYKLGYIVFIWMKNFVTLAKNWNIKYSEENFIYFQYLHNHLNPLPFYEIILVAVTNITIAYECNGLRFEGHVAPTLFTSI